MLSCTLSVTLDELNKELYYIVHWKKKKKADQHRQKAPRYADEIQFNEGKHTDVALIPGHLRKDATKDAEKQTWHMCAQRTIKTLLFFKSFMKISSLQHIA